MKIKGGGGDHDPDNNSINFKTFPGPGEYQVFNKFNVMQSRPSSRYSNTINTEIIIFYVKQFSRYTPILFIITILESVQLQEIIFTKIIGHQVLGLMSLDLQLQLRLTGNLENL